MILLHMQNNVNNLFLFPVFSYGFNKYYGFLTEQPVAFYPAKYMAGYFLAIEIRMDFFYGCAAVNQ